MPALVPATVDERRDPHAGLPAHVERAHALGAVDLVRRERHQVGLARVDAEGNLAGALHRVDVEEGAARLHHLADLVHRLHHADLVVGEHHRHQDGVRLHRRLDHLGGDQPVGERLQVGHLAALLLEALAGVEHALVLGLHGDDVVALVLVEVGDALDGEVVGLGGARGPDDLLAGGADEATHLLARLLDGLLGHPAEVVVAAGGVAELAGEVREHLLEDAPGRPGWSTGCP